MPIYSFPDTLKGNGYPYMRISIRNDKKTIINLFTPQGLSFQDGASYGTVNLGTLGALVGDDLAALEAKAQSAINNIGLNTVKQAAGNSIDALKSNAGVAVAALANKAPRNLAMNGSVSSAKEMISYSQGKILNPYTNAAFNASQIRSYQFSFKMIANNSSESQTIREIIQSLRVNMYPEGDSDFTLAYPSKFDISFWAGSSAAGGDIESRDLPKPFECNLTNLSTVYNATSNIWFEDGSPSEVDVSLTFQETRPLTAGDIRALEKKKVKTSEERRISRRVSEIISGGGLGGL